jgi:hypothetical protein
MANRALSFPLYDQLQTKALANQDQTIDLSRICQTLNHLDTSLASSERDEHYRLIGALILHYELTQRGPITRVVPMGGETLPGGIGLVYRIAEFPINLQRLLAQYVEEYSFRRDIV